jgi:hypothetical protein
MVHHQLRHQWHRRCPGHREKPSRHLHLYLTTKLDSCQYVFPEIRSQQGAGSLQRAVIEGNAQCKGDHPSVAGSGYRAHGMQSRLTRKGVIPGGILLPRRAGGQIPTVLYHETGIWSTDSGGRRVNRQHKERTRKTFVRPCISAQRANRIAGRKSGAGCDEKGKSAELAICRHASDPGMISISLSAYPSPSSGM